MNDPNRMIKWLLVVALIILSVYSLYPPERKLKGGIDLVGGTSLLYEIDTTGIDPRDIGDLSARVMRILRERVDPKGQMNLEWRPVGSTRLEVRMPQPPAIARERRQRYDEAIAKILARNVQRYEIEAALNAAPAEREQALAALVRQVPKRAELLKNVLDRYQEKSAAQASGVTVAAQAAVEAYEKAMNDLLATSFPVGRLTDVLATAKGETRVREINRLKEEFPEYDADRLITSAIQRHAEWSENKGSLEDPSDLKRLLRGAGVLEFRILADRDASSPAYTASNDPSLKQPIAQYTEQLARFGPRLRAGDRYRWLPVVDILSFLDVKTIDEVNTLKSMPGTPIVEEYAGRWYVLVHNDAEYSMLKSSGQNKWRLVKAYPDRNPLTGENVVSFQLDVRGGKQFRRLTGQHVGRQLAISLDETIASYANIKEEIGEHCQISGRMTPEKVQEYVRILDAGSLPARLKDTPLAEKTIGPSLGQTNRENGIKAAIWGSVLVLVFVIAYYGVIGGGVADIALALNLLFTLAIMALMEATFTLPGIAGLVLAVGMAIDANVLIFERIREEVARGVIFKKALNAGYDKAFSAIFDGNLTTLITCVILGFVGSEEVKGFAITLGIGIATSMFTALTVTRLVFNTLVANGLLNGFHMMKIIGIPNIDWIGLRRIFWPASTAAVVAGLFLFVYMSVARTQTLFDIEFLGGTSVQIDLKPGVVMSDEQVRARIQESGGVPPSASQWLREAADELSRATAEDADTPGKFRLTSTALTGNQLAALMRNTLSGQIETGGVETVEHSAVFESKPGQLTLATFKEAVARAATGAREAAEKLRNARVQSVGEVDRATKSARSYEVMTTETNRDMVQTAIVAALADQLQIQRAIPFRAVHDDVMTREPWFIVEAEDRYLSDVLGGTANFDIREFRGGVVISVELDPTAVPVTVEEVKRRVREVGLQPEFEQYRLRKFEVFPLGESVMQDGANAYRRFAVAALDENFLFDQDANLWAEGLARPTLAQIEAALEREKSLSQVIQFDRQVAGQSKNRAIFAGVLAMLAICVYIWFRFGTKDFGLAVLVCLAHDVCIILGFIAVTHFIHDTFLGRLLMINDFKVDLTMIAALLTLIGYSLNDTIVVFDRIRENRGKLGALSANLINTAINQTMSRTILTSLTVFFVVFILYIMGGAGIHSFAYTLCIGIILGTYSTVAVAVPLVYQPQTLRTITIILAAALAIGAILLLTDAMMIRGILALATLVICGLAWNRFARTPAHAGSRQFAGMR